MKTIRIKTHDFSFAGTLNDSVTAQEIFNALPVSSEVNTWGDEIYFPIPVNVELEKGFSADTVNLGDLAYWPEGACFCVFFGKTPISNDDKIRPASTVVVVGTIDAAPEDLKKISSGQTISIECA